MTKLCARSSLSGVHPVGVVLEDARRIAVYLAGDQVYATEDRCSHGKGMLSEGHVEGYEVVCPFHRGRFDIRTGRAAGAPCVKPIRSYAVLVQGNDVFLND